MINPEVVHIAKHFLFGHLHVVNGWILGFFLSQNLAITYIILLYSCSSHVAIAIKEYINHVENW